MKRRSTLGRWIVIAAATALLIGAGGIYTASVLARNRAIGTEYAVQFARVDAGLDAEDLTEQTAYLSRENGQYVYRVRFSTEDGEFDYTVRASDGGILSREGDFESVKKKAAEASSSSRQNETESTGSAGTGMTALVGMQDDMTAGVRSESVAAEAADEETASSAQSAASVPAVTEEARPIGYIGVDKAKELAAGAFGLKAGDVTFTKAKLEREDGSVIYDLEFYDASSEYDCELDAMTGQVTEKSSEIYEVQSSAARNDEVPDAPDDTVGAEREAAVPDAADDGSGEAYVEDDRSGGPDEGDDRYDDDDDRYDEDDDDDWDDDDDDRDDDDDWDDDDDDWDDDD